MCRRLLSSQKGISLVEVITTLAIVGIFSLLILNFMINGMANYNRVNDKILLQDEANFVMQTFVDRIYDATRVEMVEKTADSSLIKVRNFEGREAVLGIKNNQAVINGQPIHADRFVFLNGSGLEMTGEKSVAITLIIEDKISGQNVKLENSVSYLKANGGD